MPMPHKLFSSSVLVCLLTVSAHAEEHTTQLEAVIVTGSQQEKGDLPKGPLIAQESSAGKMNVPIMETPRSVDVITEQRIEDQNAQTVQDALQYSAGVYGGAFGQDVRGDWSYIRGTAPVQYVDGLKSLFGYYNNTRPHPDTLQTIEILKGPASVEYGQGSVGGVVNLNSKLPQAKELREIKLEYGSFNHKQVTGDFSGKANEDGTLLYRMVLVGRDADTQVDYVEDDSFIFRPSLTWAPTNDTRMTVLANIQEDRSGTSLQFLPWAGTIHPGPAGQIDPGVFLSEPGWDRYDTSHRSITGLFDHNINDTWSIRAAARYSDSSSAYDSMWPDFPPTINPDNTVSRTVYVSRADAEAFTSDLRANADFNTGFITHQASFGADFQDSTTDNDTFYGYGAGGLINVYDPVYGNIPVSTPISDAPESTTRQLGFYALDHMTIDENWIVSLGLRHDSASSKRAGGEAQDDNAISFSSGLMYRFYNGFAPYVSYAESFTPVIGTDFAGNTFDPLEGKQYEAGLKYQPQGTNALFTASVFTITEQNRTTNDPANPGFSVQTGEVEIDGLELEAKTGWRDFDLQASYSYLDGKVSKSNDGTQGTAIPYVPDHLTSAWITWRPSAFWQKFRAGAGIRYAGTTSGGGNSIETPTYTLLDAMLGYDVTEAWSLQLNAKNLTDEIYIPSCGSRGDCAYGQGRTLIASTTVRF